MHPTRAARAAGLALLSLLSACGGGDDTTEGAAATREVPLATATPAQAQWSSLRTLPLVPVSAANLPDRRLLVNGGISRAATSLYDPATNTWSTGGADGVLARLAGPHDTEGQLGLHARRLPARDRRAAPAMTDLS